MKNTLIITADNPESIRLFEQAYADIYIPAFPDVQERESLPKMLHLLQNPPDDYKIILIIAQDGDGVTGMCVSFYYKKYQSGVLSYNAVLPSAQSQGVGKMLVAARIARLQELSAADGQTLKCVVIEVDNPNDATKDSAKAAAKIRLFQKWGARLVNCDYVQPPLDPGKERQRNLLLMSYPINGVYPENSDVMRYVRGIYDELLGADYANDIDFKYVQQQLES